MFGTHPSLVHPLLPSRLLMVAHGVHARTPTLNLNPPGYGEGRGLYLLPRFTPICTASIQSLLHPDVSLGLLPSFDVIVWILVSEMVVAGYDVQVRSGWIFLRGLHEVVSLSVIC